MKKGTNDNDTWTSIGLAAARVLQRCEQKNEGDNESSSGSDGKERALNQAEFTKAEFLKAGLDRIRRFEERAAGVDAAGRKRRV